MPRIGAQIHFRVALKDFDGFGTGLQEARTQLMCTDPNGVEPIKFITLLSTARMLAGGVPWFSRASDFMNFITGAPDSLYTMLSSLLGGGSGAGSAGGGSPLTGSASGSSMLFTPLVFKDPNTTTAMPLQISTQKQSSNKSACLRRKRPRRRRANRPARGLRDWPSVSARSAGRCEWRPACAAMS